MIGNSGAERRVATCRAAAVLVGASAFLTGCIHADATPAMSSDLRWARLVQPTDDEFVKAVCPTLVPPKKCEPRRPVVAVYSYPAAPDPERKYAFKDLPDRGQEALLKALPAKTTSLADLKAVLFGTFKESDDPDAPLDRTMLKRTVVISISDPVDGRLADRFERADIVIEPVSHATDPTAQDFEFAGYTVAVAESKALTLAHVDRKQDNTFTGELKPAFGVGAASILDVSGRREASTDISSDIAQTYVPVYPDIIPEKLTLHRRAGKNSEISGNTLISLSVQQPPVGRTLFAYLGTTTIGRTRGVTAAPSRTELSVRPLNYLPRCDLKVRVTVRSKLRVVVAGEQNYDESRQTVAYVDATAGNAGTLVRGDDAEGLYYSIAPRVDADTEPDERVFLETHDIRAPLLFDGFQAANAMAERLNHGRRDTAGAEGWRLSLNRGLYGPEAPIGQRAFVAKRYVVGCDGEFASR